MSETVSKPFAPNDLPPQAAALALQYAVLFRNLPPVLAASLLSQVRGYDWQFQAERRELEGQLHLLSEPPSAETERILADFRALPMPERYGDTPWTAPEAFLQSFTAYLWHVHATEQFRAAGEAYGSILDAVRSQSASSADRLVVVLIGQGAQKADAPLFEKLRQRGTYFPNLKPDGVVPEAASLLEKRASSQAAPQEHWFLDGGSTAAVSSAVTYSHLSFDQVGPVRADLARYVRQMLRTDNAGPEKVRSSMMSLKAADLKGFPAEQDEVTRNFAVRVLCDGSGTQNLSTSFVQWAARELLRRAQPATLVAHFAPRLQQVDFLDDSAGRGPLDAQGALVDGDMGAYYTWINLQRVPGSGRKAFLAVAENGQGAVAVGPGMSAGAAAANSTTLTQVVQWMLG